MNESPQPPVEPQTPPEVLPVQTPSQAPIAATDRPHGQPVPSNQTPQNTTDIFGIISIVLAFMVFHVPGLIVGLIGVSKAKREGRSPLLSRIGWILNLVFMLFAIGALIFFIAIGLLSANSLERVNSDSNLSSQSLASESIKEVSRDGFSLFVPKGFTDIPFEYRNTDANYTQGDDSTNEYALVIKENLSDFRSDMTVGDYAELINSDYRTGDSIKNAVVAPVTDILNPGNLNIQDFSVSGETGDIQVIYYVRYVKTATSFYQVLTWTSPSTVDSAKNDLYAILESFRGE